ncbi:MAG: putative tryptophan/tyrosine transport system substrate-binding protein [Candidatus Dependentiae bacterium]|nr:putative tryptophan/tyrosine transport system substrate-binding protein [Candidatus Dependentiae bacterium]
MRAGIRWVFAILVLLITGVITLFWSVSNYRSNVVVLASSTVLIHEEIYKGVCRGAAQSRHRSRLGVVPYLFSHIDRVQIAGMCEAAIASRPDLIISVGATSTQILHELLQKRQLAIPVVYVGVNDPVRIGLIESLERPGGSMTGVAEYFDPLASARLVLIVKPGVRDILIPYDSAGATVDMVIEAIVKIKNYFEPYAVQVRAMPLDSSVDVLAKFCSVISEYDLVMGIEIDPLIHQFSAGLAKLCEQFNVTFFSTISSGVVLGAAITYATSAERLGEQAIAQAEKIIFDGVSPAVMPVLAAQNARELFINMKTAMRGGCALNIEQIMRDIASEPDLGSLENKVNIIW